MLYNIYMKKTLRKIVYIFAALFCLDMLAVFLISEVNFFVSIFSPKYSFSAALFFNAWRMFEVLVIIFALFLLFENDNVVHDRIKAENQNNKNKKNVDK